MYPGEHANRRVQKDWSSFVREKGQSVVYEYRIWRTVADIYIFTICVSNKNNLSHQTSTFHPPHGMKEEKTYPHQTSTSVFHKNGERYND